MKGMKLAACFAFLVYSLCLPGIALAEDDPALQRRKAELELKKLEFEVAALSKSSQAWPNSVATVVGFLLGGAGTAATLWGARRARFGAVDQSVHEKRLDLYPLLVKACAPLALYFPVHASVGPKECQAMGQAMSEWYFGAGGLLLSVESRDAYFKLARALTLASLADNLKSPVYPNDAPEICKERVDTYREKLRMVADLDDVENWSFGGAGSERNDASDRFRDFVFLQQLSSRLRTSLSEDLRSRRRPT